MGCGSRATHNFSVQLKATTNPNELPDCDLGIVATKATQVAESFRLVGNRFDQGAVLSAQNGLGSEEIIADSHSRLGDPRHHFHERDTPQRHSRSIRTRHCNLDGSV